MKTLGVIGGMGPMSTFYFCEKVFTFQNAQKDQDNIPMVILNDPSIPDRTEFLLDNSLPNPLPQLQKNLKILNDLHVDYITIICNTSYAFIDTLTANSSVEILNMPELAVRFLKTQRVKKIGLTSTSGAKEVGIYQKYAQKHQLKMECVNETMQQKLMTLIYDQVKANNKPSLSLFEEVMAYLKQKGCEKIILGCTELCLVKEYFQLSNEDLINPVEILAQEVLVKCTKKGE